VTISRPAPRRWPLVAAAALAGIAIGLILGLALAGGDDSADSEQALRDLRSKVTQAAGLLEIAPVEYGQGVRDGAVASAPEYRGARDAVNRSRALYADARPSLLLISGAAVRRIDPGYERLSRAMAAMAPASDVRRLARELSGALEEPLGLRVEAG
jgi:hypothetical protein